MSIPALVLHKLTTNHPARSGLWTSLRAHLARINAAHEKQARLSRLTEADSRDTGLSPQDLLNESAHDPALPFFLQSSFERR